MPLSSIFRISRQIKGVSGDFFFIYIETVYNVESPFQIEEICNLIHIKGSFKSSNYRLLFLRKEQI